MQHLSSDRRADRDTTLRPWVRPARQVIAAGSAEQTQKVHNGTDGFVNS